MSRSTSGGQVPLSAFTHYEPGTTPLIVNHQGQFPAVTISFNLAPGYSLGDAVTRSTTRKSEIGMPRASRPLPGHRRGLPRLADQRAAADSGRAGHGLHRARASCTRATSIRSRFSRRCRRPASARSSRC